MLVVVVEDDDCICLGDIALSFINSSRTVGFMALCGLLSMMNYLQPYSHSYRIEYILGAIVRSF